MKVSVIVPVYNVENYLDKCLNSLVKQTLKDLEIIDRYWENLAIKEYSTVPRVEISEIGKVREKVLQFNQQQNMHNFRQKLFAIIKNTIKIL